MHAPHHVTDMSQSPNQRRRTWVLGGPWGAGRAPQTPGMAANQASVCVPHPARQPEGEGVPRGSPFPRGPHAAPADRSRGVWSHQHSQASVGATEHGRDLISLAGHLAAPARSRPPACHRHLASNSSRPDPPPQPRWAGRAAESLASDSRLLTGGAWATGRPARPSNFRRKAVSLSAVATASRP